MQRCSDAAMQRCSDAAMEGLSKSEAVTMVDAAIGRWIWYAGWSNKPINQRAHEPTCRPADLPTCRPADVPTCRRADMPTTILDVPFRTISQEAQRSGSAKIPEAPRPEMGAIRAATPSERASKRATPTDDPGRQRMILETDDPLALAAVAAIHSGDVAQLQQLLNRHDGLAAARLGDPDGMSRTLLHVVTDWPGHFPNGPQTVTALVTGGADVNARFTGPHTETALHWAASSDDVDVLDALLDAGADIEADGAVIAGGTPLDDASAFLQWNAARRLVERGAVVNLYSAATLGLMDQIEHLYATDPSPTAADTTVAFWRACHGGQQTPAEYLLAHGADLNWIPDWEPLTPLDTARRNHHEALARWLTSAGALSAATMKPSAQQP